MTRVHNSTDTAGTPKPVAKKPSHSFNPAAAICVLWAVTTPAPTRLDQKGFEWSVIVHEPFDEVARELVRLGILQEVRGPRAGDLWIDAYRLAPLQQPLKQRHSKTVMQSTHHIFPHP